MLKRPRLNMSSRTKLITFAFVAVMLPTTVLSVIQYRSLVDLEGKTKVAVQENLWETLMTISHKVEGKLDEVAKQALMPVGVLDIEDENLSRIESHFAGIKQIHPEIDQLFVVSRSSRTGADFALLYTPEGLHKVTQAQFKDNRDATDCVKSFDSARLARPSADLKNGFLFWQTPCACNTTATTAYRTYIFRPVFCPDTDGYSPGFVGLSLNTEYIQETVLPEVMPALLRGCDSDNRDPNLALGVLDEDNHEIYTSEGGPSNYEVKMAFNPGFPRWRLGIGYKDTTIEALAKNNFQHSVMITVLVSSLLLLGIVLTLRATARELKLAQAKSTFVSNVSHELKTPLALIRLFAETLELGRVKSAEKAQEYYRIINNESRRLTQLINNILDFSKIEAGRKEYEFAEADAAEVVEDVIKSYEYQISSAGFELKKEIGNDLPPVRIDRDAISQAVLNLVNNALKYSDEAKEITVRVYAVDAAVAMEVADKGIGIPRSEQEKVFEKFYRVSTGLVHDTKGSGLGLALVKHIVESHGGKIMLDSAPGKGSKFTILIPSCAAGADSKEPKRGTGGLTVAESANH